jgi:hypothetical protein
VTTVKNGCAAQSNITQPQMPRLATTVSALGEGTVIHRPIGKSGNKRRDAGASVLPAPSGPVTRMAFFKVAAQRA